MKGQIGFLGIVVLALVLLFLLGGFALGPIGFLGSLVINSVIALILLFLVDMLGLKIPINIVSILVVLIFGLLGLALLALLSFMGVYKASGIQQTSGMKQ